MELIRYQLKALDHGLLVLADSMADLTKQVVAEGEEDSYVKADSVKAVLKKALADALKEGSSVSFFISHHFPLANFCNHKG